MSAPRDEHLRFRAALGVALVGVIDDAFERGDVTLAERLLRGLLHKLPPGVAADCPQAGVYLATALNDVRGCLWSSGGGGLPRPSSAVVAQP